ncbi:MAG: Smr/MutS family protein [Rhodobacteraceae bacterium]|nr:Smr/MutS family protein [Paracoccaceae bacterium]
MTRRPGKTLSREDRDLWAKVAHSTNPMVLSQKAPVHVLNKSSKKRPSRFRVRDFQIGERATGSTKHPERTSSAPVRMDHGTYRRMQCGKMKLEGRLDFHGMTLAEAHPRLIRFIQTAHAAQKRLVLVITGKGKARYDSGPIPVRCGVLRYHVPHWLKAPPLGAIVQHVCPAHAQHGGDGAYYVYLRRNR